MKKLIFTISTILLITSQLFSQNQTKNVRPGQLTIIYPLSTNGFNSYDYSNIMSLNLIIGLNGGVEGFEVGGVGNINDSVVNGFQAAGVFNITKGNVNGFQAAANLNVNHGNFNGAQLNGMLNVNTGNFDGIQIAGFGNINKGNVKGVQISCCLNSNYGYAEGVQIAGLMNNNLSMPDKKEIDLVQISGLINQNNSPAKGSQITSILNVSTDTLKGVQIGLINIGTYVDGAQIGLINITAKDSTDVVPIGLLNFVKGGLFEFEVGATDLIYANINFKMGVEKFYTIFKIGYSIYAGNSVYTHGLGIGRYFNINEKNRLNFDISYTNLSEIPFMVTRNEVLTKIDLNYKRMLTPKFSFYIGPSFNYYIAEDWGQGESFQLQPLYYFSKESYIYFDAIAWIGVNAGVSFRF